ncbi:MAG: glycosyltransferase [Parcubacteria group bacterium Gr01-1014_31]|nr:MAG: glycosyltransferase [Parcubacteria group bacterium Gr01-1014_31]
MAPAATDEHYRAYLQTFGNLFPAELAILQNQGQLTGEWSNVADHCLTEAAAADILAELLQLPAADRTTLVKAALLHDWYKRKERERVTREGQGTYDASAATSEQGLAALGVDPTVVTIAHRVGHTQCRYFLDHPDAPLLERAMFWLDTVTHGNRIVGINERVDQLESADRYRELNEQGRAVLGGKTYFQAQRGTALAIERQLTQRTGTTGRLDDEIRRRLETRCGQTATPSSGYTVSIVIPCRNEEGNIDAAVVRVPQLGRSTDIIFIEGGSRDHTRTKIQAAISGYRGPLHLRLITCEGDPTKGEKVRRAFADATGDILMILDGDLTVPPEDLSKFYEVLASGQGQFANGTRMVLKMERGAMQFINRIANWCFGKIFSVLLRQRLTDTLCGTKVLFKKDYERIVANRHEFGDFDPFGDFDLLFGAARLGLKITEVPVQYRERTYGKTNIRRWSHGVLLAKMCWFAFTKRKLFVKPTFYKLPPTC